ncbi:DUF2142 domain-containing protein [Nocardioides sp.]|uniref:DUF2142 domain-containing protein n=1 Tax=Nocardioides sp. TaxID=35761 RepID=UPI002D80E880|nr:DUF2142 domain-containing protein [Nocardioides sp.]HET8960447.1 DUF2142 domain-containing protein [Nocardioides sp.]
MSRNRVDWPVLALVGGLLLAQLAWLVGVPPFRGMDEWDHAYRAAAVAEGTWVAEPTEATRGTGAVLRVPAHIVAATRPECERLPYTNAEDCVGRPDGETVLVPSGAGRYHPAFYALIGYPAMLFQGTDALYAMRITGLLACWGFFLLAVLCLRRWASGSAPPLAFALALTPTVIFTSAIAAPNGVEMAAGLAWSSALIGLGLAATPQHDRLYLGVAAISGSVLVTVRSLGPLWCALVLVTCLVALPVSTARIRQVVGRPMGALALVAVALSTMASVVWTLSQRSLVVGVDPAELTWSQKVMGVGELLIQWPLQAIGAFPYRDAPAPPLVYVVYLLLVGGCLVVALRSFDRRGRWALGLGIATLFLLPAIVTLATADRYGAAWQGRYELPYGVCLLLLAGVAWQRKGIQIGARVALPGLVLFAIGQVVGPVQVLRNELATSPYSGTNSWASPPVAVEALLMTSAAALIWWGAWAMGWRGSNHATEEAVRPTEETVNAT